MLGTDQFVSRTKVGLSSVQLYTRSSNTLQLLFLLAQYLSQAIPLKLHHATLLHRVIEGFRFVLLFGGETFAFCGEPVAVGRQVPQLATALVHRSFVLGARGLQARNLETSTIPLAVEGASRSSARACARCLR